MFSQTKGGEMGQLVCEIVGQAEQQTSEVQRINV